MTSGPTGDTIGEIFKRTRENKKLSIEDVNRETKISVNVIRALEQDDMDSFASETYLKGFVKNYAYYLGLDANRLWGMLSKQHGKVPDVSGTFWDIEEAVREEKLKSPRIVQRIVIPLLVVVILVLGFLYVKERASRDSRAEDEHGSRAHRSACVV